MIMAILVTKSDDSIIHKMFMLDSIISEYSRDYSRCTKVFYKISGGYDHKELNYNESIKVCYDASCNQTYKLG